MPTTQLDHPPQRDVLVVSTTPMLREVFHDIFVAAGYQCLLAATGREAIEVFRGGWPSLVVTDFNIHDMSALELLQDLRREDPDAAVIILCGAAYRREGEVLGVLDAETVRRAGLTLGAHAVLEKPVDPEELLRAADAALESRQLARRRRQPLEYHWDAVRPMASLSELLAVFAAVFSPPLRDAGVTGHRVDLKRR